MRRLRLPVLLTVMVLAVSLVYHRFWLLEFDTIFTIESPWTLTSLVICLTFFFLRIVDVIILSSTKNMGSVRAPKLIFDVLNFIIMAIVILFLMSRVFHQPITGVLAASGALGVIIGLSLQRMIADIFTGFALHMDKSIQLNDWIEYTKPGGEPILGQVREISWRTVNLLTYNNDVIIIPNGALATDVIKNYSKPSSKSMFTVDFTLDFEVPSDRALNILEAAAVSVKEVLDKPRPKVYVDRVTDRGVKYKIRFWLDINNVNIFRGMHLVYNSALHHIHQSGLSLSYSKHDVYYKPMPQRHLDRHTDIVKLIKLVPLFTMLKKSELNIIKKGIRELAVPKETTVVKAGNPGSSMFILVEGVLDVVVNKINKGRVIELKVNQLTPGDFFGEMSLLTGAPRSASVITKTDSKLYEINKRTILEILKNRPEVGRKLSRILAKRAISNKNLKQNYKASSSSLASSIFTKMKRFFFG